jgi:hypothetical protein
MTVLLLGTERLTLMRSRRLRKKVIQVLGILFFQKGGRERA